MANKNGINISREGNVNHTRDEGISRSIETQHIDTFVESLQLPDQRILQKFSLTLNGRELSEEEAKQFINFMRKHISVGK